MSMRFKFTNSLITCLLFHQLKMLSSVNTYDISSSTRLQSLPCCHGPMARVWDDTNFDKTKMNLMSDGPLGPLFQH